MLKLVAVAGGEEFSLSGTEISVGRESSNDIVISHELLSRRHAKLRLEGGECVIEDLGSTNGTYVNNRQINRPVGLKVGDVVKFGKQAFILATDGVDGQTIIASRLPQRSASEGGCVVIDEDNDHTSFQQSYHLPQGWDNDEPTHERYSKESVDKLLKGILASKGPIPDLAIVVYIAQRKPQLFGVSRTKGDGVWSIGRGEGCKIRIDDPSVSKLHANLTYKNAMWGLEDAGSTNGLRVNNEIRSSMAIKDGGFAKLGRAEILFRTLK